MSTGPVRTFHADQLDVSVFSDRQGMGRAAADHVATILTDLARSQKILRIVFASAPSQNEFLAELLSHDELPWNRFEAFHMDEYLGIDPSAPQCFGQFIQERLWDRVPLMAAHLINSQARDPQAECQRYADLLQRAPIDLVCMGIGENGHIAFNDPPVADFDDPALVKIVELDSVSRQQQVHDGAFGSADLVPRQAITLTIPALINAQYLSVVVPGKLKQVAVRNTLERAVDTDCPATVLRRHKQAKLFLDQESAGLIAESEN